MRFSVVLAFTLFVSLVQAKEPPKSLQIGVKKRIPDAECSIRSRKGDRLSMHYVGTLFDSGKEFDSSRSRNQPLEFQLGMGQVIKGWDQGLQNMCIGEQRKLIIPPDLAYGEGGFGSLIPPKSTLVFEVELVDINRHSEL
ncbi:uncharacterized protein VTP21DRAFT_11069 [Calcarisporiella thermophila]|uniref:uncharacterized protein n=1 Tax=Calcarisporiella thermophila TaxID=911321 RepID=UPI003742A6C9